MDQRTHFLRWPSLNLLKTYLFWQGLFLSSFILIYGTCNYLSSFLEKRTALYWDWELAIPLVPWMMLFYRGLDLTFILHLFVLDEKRIRGVVITLWASLLFCLPVFLLFPTELGLGRPEYVDGFSFLFKFLYSIDRPHNLFPSLHVTYATINILAMIEATSKISGAKWIHALLLLFLIMVSLSILFVHQHHVADLISGLLLGLIGYRLVYLKVLKRSQSKSNLLLY